MTDDDLRIPPAPSPPTEQQIRASHGRNAVEVHDDEPGIDIIAHGRVATAALSPDDPRLPPERWRVVETRYDQNDQITRVVHHRRIGSALMSENDAKAYATQETARHLGDRLRTTFHAEPVTVEVQPLDPRTQSHCPGSVSGHDGGDRYGRCTWCRQQIHEPVPAPTRIPPGTVLGEAYRYHYDPDFGGAR